MGERFAGGGGAKKKKGRRRRVGALPLPLTRAASDGGRHPLFDRTFRQQVEQQTSMRYGARAAVRGHPPRRRAPAAPPASCGPHAFFFAGCRPLSPSTKKKLTDVRLDGGVAPGVNDGAADHLDDGGRGHGGKGLGLREGGRRGERTKGQKKGVDRPGRGGVRTARPERACQSRGCHARPGAHAHALENRDRSTSTPRWVGCGRGGRAGRPPGGVRVFRVGERSGQPHRRTRT